MLLSATAVWGWTFPVVKDAVDRLRRRRLPRHSLRHRFGVARRAGGPAIQQAFALGRRRHRHRAGDWATIARPLGLRYTTATNSGFITGLFVVTTPIINRLLFGVKIRPIFWVAVAVSLRALSADKPVRSRRRRLLRSTA